VHASAEAGARGAAGAHSLWAEPAAEAEARTGLWSR
jgi:hypothetical protein